MYKKIIAVISAVLILVMGMAGCSGKPGGSDPAQTDPSQAEPSQAELQENDYTDDIAIVKEVFDKIKADDAVNQITYFVSFKLKYSTESKKDSEFESDHYTLSYEGDGTVALSFDTKGTEVVSTDFFDPEVVGKDLLINGVGYLTGFQHEKYTYKDEFTDKTADGENRTEDVSKENERTFEIAVDDDRFYASSNAKSQDFNDPGNDAEDSFSGKIMKAAFIDAIPAELISDAASNLLYMDAWPYIRTVTAYSNELFANMDFSDDAAINTFFEENDIRAEKTDESVRISFVLDVSSAMERSLPDPTPGAHMKVSGTMEFDKETGELTEYAYDMAELLSEILKADEADRDEFSSKVDEFTVTGKNVVLTENKVKIVLDDIVNKEYEEYDSASGDEFMDAIVEHLMPSGK